IPERSLSAARGGVAGAPPRGGGGWGVGGAGRGGAAGGPGRGRGGGGGGRGGGGGGGPGAGGGGGRGGARAAERAGRRGGRRAPWAPRWLDRMPGTGRRRLRRRGALRPATISSSPTWTRSARSRICFARCRRISCCGTASCPCGRKGRRS